MAHVKLPKELFTEELFQELSLEAKVLYAFFADRTSLSRTNKEKWTLPSGEVYIIYRQQDIQRILRCGHDKASKVVRELVKIGLVKKIPQGLGKPNLIIVDTCLLD